MKFNARQYRLSDQVASVNQFQAKGNVFLEGSKKPNEKILLVDDEASNIRLFTQWLVPLGYYIEVASNGNEAIQKAKNGLPDLIILDIIMPVMNGYVRHAGF